MYISQDPIRLNGGLNLYAYVGDLNRWVDIFGLNCIEGDLGRHGDLKKEEGGGQSHHLNQDAAFRDVIPREDGAAIKLEGNAFSDIDSNHYNAHQNLEGFWDKYRAGGELEGKIPTVDEYNVALRESLNTTTLSPEQIDAAMNSAKANQIQYGLSGNSSVPRIPGRINQKKI